ncbi:MAG: UDP-glucose/GDP-mannose dehydrogenase family protein [Spirochaetaceae bacterium]|nr:MAG: UDP-glucose/GDP-mannose dehydrogenase family protein [Spirochaetaceae bacterium]
MAKRITILGTGYVGLVAAVGLSDFGNHVTAADKHEGIVQTLRQRKSTIYEHGLEEYLMRNIDAGRLFFTTDVAAAVQNAEVVVLAVGTPIDANGQTDLSQVQEAVLTIRESLNEYKVIVTKSTVPVGTNRWIEKTLLETKSPELFSIVSNPEFLREGHAIHDFFHPDRVVIGCEEERARKAMEEIYRPLYLIHTPFVWCNLETAEIVKYASNAFLATKITYINQIANLCEAVGADIHVIARAMGMDGRISPKFLHPGPGYGGSCLPKDTRELVNTGERYGVDMAVVRSVVEANEYQKSRVVERLKALLELKGKRIAVLGLAYKSETDDVRDSPAIAIVERLLAAGAEVHAHDPKAADRFRALFPNIRYYESEFSAVEDADAVLILTEWNEYRNVDLEKMRSMMRGDILFDIRNVLEPEAARRLGFRYYGTGR